MYVSQVCSTYLYVSLVVPTRLPVRTGHFMQLDLALTFATVLYFSRPPLCNLHALRSKSSITGTFFFGLTCQLKPLASLANVNQLFLYSTTAMNLDKKPWPRWYIPTILVCSNHQTLQTTITSPRLQLSRLSIASLGPTK